MKLLLLVVVAWGLLLGFVPARVAADEPAPAPRKAGTDEPVPAPRKAGADDSAPAPRKAPEMREPQPRKVDLRESAYQHTEEISGFYDGLTGGLGNWSGVRYTRYDHLDKTTTLLLSGEGVYRTLPGQTEMLGVVGAYKDWSDRFFTYSALSGGTNSAWYPAWRFDTDFNVKWGNTKRLVTTIGFTQIQSHGLNSDTILSAGVAYYQDRYLLGYRHYFNRSNPGNVASSADEINLAIGREGHSRIEFVYGFGQQAYLAGLLLPTEVPVEVRRPSQSLRVLFRTWTSKDKGYFINAQHVDVNGAYKLNGLEAGLFRTY